MTTEMFTKIYNMQHDLNCIVGRDTVNAPNKLEWLYDYCQALEDEVIELKNCVNWKWWSKESKEFGQYNKLIDPKNAKVEAIDILHFYISLLHIADIKDLNFDHFDNLESRTPSVEIFYNCEHLMASILEIKSSTKWFEGDDFLIARTELSDEVTLEDIQDLIIEMWINILSIFKSLDMTLEDILNIYEMKHQKNVQRQKDNYAVLTKTEDDNNEIKSRI